MEELLKVEELEDKKKSPSICGISIWRLYSYFIIYGVLGYIIETIFQIANKGLFESKQSFLYGPFCAVYSVGAIIMILSLKKVQDNKIYLFVGGFLLGTIAEYIMSLVLEKLFGVVWWDYSNLPLNINGRVCVLFSIYWGALAIILLSYVNPKVDQFINMLKEKVPYNQQKTIIAIVMIFLTIDALLTCFALYAFNLRIVHNYNIEVTNKEEVEIKYEELYGNEILSDIIYKFFDDTKMIRTFPTTKIVDAEGNIIYLREVLSDIQAYYYKFDF